MEQDGDIDVAPTGEENNFRYWSEMSYNHGWNGESNCFGYLEMEEDFSGLVGIFLDEEDFKNLEEDKEDVRTFRSPEEADKIEEEKQLKQENEDMDLYLYEDDLPDSECLESEFEENGFTIIKLEGDEDIGYIYTCTPFE